VLAIRRLVTKLGDYDMKRMIRVEKPLNGTYVGDPTGIVHQEPGRTVVHSDSVAQREIYYLRKYPFELGDVYISDSRVVYSVDEKYSYHFHNALTKINSKLFKNTEMAKEFSKYLPSIDWECEDSSGRFWLSIKKTPDQFLLSDVLSYFGGKLGSRHVAWIMSNLHNIVCYLKFSGWAHNGITSSTCFISPKFHSVSLLGGWWYSSTEGAPMMALPKQIISLLPPEVALSKLASVKTDLELIRAVGREALGPVPWAETEVPKALQDWLRYASPTGDPFMDYEIWDTQVLKDSFGPRKFVELEVPERIYGKEKSEIL
jgi:hypothetical protein